MGIKLLSNGLTSVERFLTGISWLTSIFVTVMIGVDVILRFVFNRPLPASWEISEVLIPLIVFLPLAHTLSIDGHVRVSLVRDRVPEKFGTVLDAFNDLISFAMCAGLTYWSWLRFLESFRINEEILAAIKIPWWPGKMAMPIGLAFLSIRFLIRLLEQFTGEKTQTA